MADPWELILHHAYTGTPGVIVDQSPGRGSHGVAINLPDGDFLHDGAQPGSGAVNFQRNSVIRVPVTKNWSPLGGLRAEVVCIRDGAARADVLIQCESFSFALRGDVLGAWFNSYPHFSEIWSSYHAIDPTFRIPNGQWMTLGFLHDGTSTLELHFNGKTVARLSQPLWPVKSVTDLSLGNYTSASAASGFGGRIDDVKIWRINPHRVDEEFIGRPVGDDVKQCWAQWSRAYGAIADDNRDCAVRLRQLLVRAIDGVIRDGLNHGDQTRDRWQLAAASYRESWAEGNPADIVPILADLISYLQLVGLDPNQNPDVVALLEDPCLKTIAGQVPPMYCDDQFTGMLGNLAKTVEKRNRNQHITIKARGV